LFKLAASSDLYPGDQLRRCVDALDENPQVVLAHSREAIIVGSHTVIKLVGYRVAAYAVRASERLWSMLFDGWNDYSYAVIRTKVLRRTAPFGSHHLADRTIITELGLLGPFYQVPDWLFFRDHPDRPHSTVRSRWLRHPASPVQPVISIDAVAAGPEGRQS
jgi:hypothetical protein